jgi:hypothetical protein
VSDVRAAAERRAGALVARDAASLRDLHHPELRWTTHLGHVLDRDAYIRGNTEGALVWRAQTLDDVVVAVAGSTAVLTAVVTDEVEQEGERRTNRLRVTQTWVQDGEGWRCLAGHAGPKL